MKFLIVLAALTAAINGLSDHSAWVEFKVKHTKEYKLVEDKIRFLVFKNNLRKIEEHNEKFEKGETSYFLTTTKFADWTTEEFKAMLSKQAASKPKVEGTLAKFESVSKSDVPASVDWRTQNAVLGVKDQGDCGSCWAFSVTGALEGQLILKQNQSISLSEQELIDCSIAYGNIGCGGGHQVPTFNYVKDKGLSSEADYPYNAQDNSCKSSSAKRVITGISDVKGVEPDEDSLISAIATVGPISVSADASDWSLYGGGIFDGSDCDQEDCYVYLNHAILAVGYENNYLVIKNSWGEDWGEAGYIRLLRGKNLCGINLSNSYPVL